MYNKIVKENKDGIEKVIGLIVLVLIVYIILNTSYYARKARDYQDACISVNMNMQDCRCVTNAYYNEQVLRKIGILPMLEVCN